MFGKKVFCLGLLSLIFVVCINAQDDLLTETRTYELKDSVRGSLTPERTWFNVSYYHLDIEVDPSSKTIAGHNDIMFQVVAENEGVMQIDLFENMSVDKIVYGEEELKFKRIHDAVYIHIPNLKPASSLETIRFYYSGKPIIAEKAPWDGGFVWEKDENNEDWIGVACEGIGASLWWPNKDHLSDEPDSMRISVTVPKNLYYAGNGVIESQEEIDADKIKYNWKVNAPINNYNVTLNIANYAHFNTTYDGINGPLSMDYYVLPSNLEKAKKHFKQVDPMMDCYEKYLGPYPFYEDGFALVETPYLGMEHQGAIAYGNEFTSGYAGNTNYTGGYEFDYIIIHEAGHEWWGNHVGCADMADLWIHEGFCTYSEGIYVECLHGKDAAIKYVNKGKKHIGNENALIGDYNVNNEGDGDMYAKGALFLNTMRHLIDNDELWWQILKGLQEDFALQQINTNDVIDYFNTKTSKNWYKVFDQYLNYGSLPSLQYHIVKKGKKTKLEYKWRSKVEGFDMPVQYRVNQGEWNWLYPNTLTYQSLQFKKIDPNSIEFAEDRFYVNWEKMRSN